MPHPSTLRDTLSALNLTGELNRNTPESNRQAIREMLARNNYWTFDSCDIGTLNLIYDQVAVLMAKALGMSVEQFASDKPPYIDPQKTADGLIEAMQLGLEVARKGGRIVLATAHPGSLLGFYTVLAAELRAAGATLLTPDEPIPAPDNRWIDSVAGVIVLSNEGDLNHTHFDMGIRKMLEDMKPDLVFSDHGFAMAAINSRIHTIAIFDVDDPAIPVMADSLPGLVTAIPMNDNQTNTRSAKGAQAVIVEISHHA